jgi:hypothetical protein
LTSSAVASWVVFRLKHGERQCWGSEKLERIPEHESTRIQEYKNAWIWNAIHERGDKESPKDCSCLKSCQSLYTCPRTPFIGRRKVFYIPKIPSNLGNIPSVNAYINVLYIPWFAGLNSYIYKSATSSHVKPGLLRLRLWLGFLLIPDCFIHEDLHISWFPNFAGFWPRNFTGSWAQTFAGSWFHNFAGSWAQSFAGSWF